MDTYFTAMRDFLEYDKGSYARIYVLYKYKIHYIIEEMTYGTPCIYIDTEPDELIDFLDDNGFIVQRNERMLIPKYVRKEGKRLVIHKSIIDGYKVEEINVER